MTAPAAVLTVPDVKSHLAISHADDDVYLATLIDVAAAYIEGPHGIGVALTTAQWLLSADCTVTSVTVPLWPVQSITTVTVDGQATPYTVDNGGTRATVKFSGAVSKPVITFTAGFGTSADVPADLKHAIRLIVGHLYNNREATSDVALSEVPMAVTSILNRYRS